MKGDLSDGQKRGGVRQDRKRRKESDGKVLEEEDDGEEFLCVWRRSYSSLTPPLFLAGQRRKNEDKTESRQSKRRKEVTDSRGGRWMEARRSPSLQEVQEMISSIIC